MTRVKNKGIDVDRWQVDWPMPDHEGPGDEDEVLYPPPDVWEFYRRHGRWPEEGEA